MAQECHSQRCIEEGRHQAFSSHVNMAVQIRNDTWKEDEELKQIWRKVATADFRTKFNPQQPPK